MKITIDIDENEIAEAVKAVLIEHLAEETRREWGAGHRFRTDTKTVMREVISKNMDLFADKAVAAAAKSIENRAVKTQMEKLMGGYTDAIGL